LARLSGFALPFLKRFQAERRRPFHCFALFCLGALLAIAGGFAGGFAGGDGLALGGGGLATNGKCGLAVLPVLSGGLSGGGAGGY
jgi:hypothetical protein